MNANWKPGEDYFIRLNPITDKAKNLKQEDFEQQLVINLMQLINAHHIAQPTKKLPLRINSYGSFNQAKIDIMKEMREEYILDFNKKRAEKWETKTNADRIQWSNEINEYADNIKLLDKFINKLESKR